VRDLLGVDVQAAADFPQDDSGYGFDNISDALSISPLLMERYLAAAERVARMAVFGPPALRPAVMRYQTPRRGPLVLPASGALDDSGLSLTNAMHQRYRFPGAGEYRFVAFLDGTSPEPLHIAFWIDGRPLRTVETAAGIEVDKQLEVRAPVTPGEHIVSLTFRNFPGGINARFHYLEIAGPFDSSTAPSAESRQLIYICSGHNPACARAIVANLARRAFRRPVSEQEVDRLTGIAAKVQREGGSFDESIATAIQAILVSPYFLFRVEKGAYGLASRLSYFLWSSIPDDELLRAAADGTLERPEGLRAQTRRMLADSKSARLAENFASQWLETRRLESIQPEVQRFPDFDDYLRDSMRRETELFFDHIVREDRSVLEFLDAKYSFMNQRLAAFYGIPGVAGPEFRQVDLTGTPRAGVLTQAGVLTVTSYANRTSPVLRGKWILANLLNAAPPAPPPNIPKLDEQTAAGPIREQMEAHRANPACAACHASMDPLGFGLENFDAIGKWRAADASGQLPGGQTFQGAAELEAILRGKAPLFIRCLTQKLMIYALGRGLEPSDERAVERIAGAGPRFSDLSFSSLILGIVESDSFRRQETAP
jgi:hypothetical protein